MLSTLIKFIKAAGAATEADSDRDGFLSYAAESHAAGMGLAAGYTATAHGDVQLLGVVYGAAVYGRAHAENQKRRRILRDVVSEPQYALGGVVAGGLLGAATRLAVGDVPAL